MGPPPGIHACMCCYHNQQNKKTETKKNGAKLFYCGNRIFFAFSQRAPDCSIVVTVLNKTCDFFGLCFFVLLIVEAAHAKADPWGGPIPRTLQELLNTFFWRCKKSHFWAQVCWISVHARVRKRFQKKCKKTRTGSRRGATPGRLGAQNRWFLTWFRPEGRLHRTRGWDCPGAHFAYDMR